VGYEVHGIGKIEDLFAHRGLTTSNHTGTNEAGMAAALDEIAHPFRGLLFVNLVDCDQTYGHRRNPSGYADALRAIDSWLATVLERMATGDALFVTGDHGTDPTYTGTDHTRESVPLLAAGSLIRRNVAIGVRSSFADLGATLAQAFGIGPLEYGTSFAAAIGLA
jgi:phosphopentomutase